MTSKERMMTAIRMGTPDRLPVTVHQWQAWHLEHTMGGISDLEAFRRFGMDAALTRYPFVYPESSQWQVSMTSRKQGNYYVDTYEAKTPKGTLTWSQGRNGYTTWEMEPMLKEDEDLELLKFRPLPYYDKAQFQKAYDQLGDDGILRTFPCGSQGGCWQDACNLYGTEELICKTFDDPEWVHALLEVLMEDRLRFIEESLRGAKVDLVENGGGAASNTVISPAIHEEFCLPYDRRMHQAIHDCGLPVVYHTCGGMTKIADLIVQNGCDASETLSPAGIGGDIRGPEDAAILCRAFKGKVGMIGGMDQINLLGGGTPDQIRKEVETLFQWYGQGGGYILSASDHFFEAPAENLQAFTDAAKACVY